MSKDDLARRGSPQEEEPRTRITSAQRDGTSRHRHGMLPNGLEIAYQSKAEVDYFYADIFEKQTYLRHGIVLRDGDCVFDVGANIGLFTLFVHRKYKNIDYYIFEPSPPVFDIVCANLAMHGVNAKLFNCGLSHRAETATLTFYPNNSGMSSFYADKDEEREALRSIMLNQLHKGMEGMEQLMRYADDLLEERFKAELFDCPLRTLSDVVAEHNVARIDLLKIDVQKSELDVLLGIKDHDWAKIRQIVLEVHDKAGRLDQVTGLLGGRGYNVVVEQDDLYTGSIISMVYAVRPYAAVASPGRSSDEEQSTGSAVQQIQARARKQAEVLNRQKQALKHRKHDQ